MRRREFVLLLSGAAAFPLAAAAQPGKIPRVGVLMLGTPDPSFFCANFARDSVNLVTWTAGTSH